MFGDLFRITLYQPLLNILVFLYETVAIQDLGLAIILLTIIVRLVLYPLFHKTAKHQRIAQQLQPEINKIKKAHKDDREKQTKAIMELYQEKQVNPLTPFFLLLLQLPFLFALYRLFVDGLSEESLTLLYSFVPSPEVLTDTLFGYIHLADTNIPLVVVAAAAQFLQGRLAIIRMSKKNKSTEQAQAEKIAKLTTVIGPFIATIILVNLPAAVALYWLTSTIFSIIQQIIVNKAVHKESDNHDTESTNKDTQTH